MLDGRHFPHILDAVLDYAAPSTLAAMSQVCSQWRQLVKREFYHLKACEDDNSYWHGPFFKTRLGMTFTTRSLVKEAPSLLRLCHVLDAESTDFYSCVNNCGLLNEAFPNLTALRLCNDLQIGIRYGLRIARYNSPPTPRPACHCCFGHGHNYAYYDKNQSVRRFAFDAWGEDDIIDYLIPPNFASLAIIFLFDSASKKDPQHADSFWKDCCTVVGDAWDAGKSAIIVNAECLHGRQQWLKNLPRSSVEEGVRRLVLNFLIDYDFSDDHWPPHSPGKFGHHSDTDYSEAESSGLDTLDSDPLQPDADNSLDSDASGNSNTSSIPSVDVGNSASESLEGFTERPPGPVCPVHFITLDEYRALVGDHEFAIDTDFGWIPEPAPTP